MILWQLKAAEFVHGWCYVKTQAVRWFLPRDERACAIQNCFCATRNYVYNAGQNLVGILPKPYHLYRSSIFTINHPKGWEPLPATTTVWKPLTIRLMPSTTLGCYLKPTWFATCNQPGLLRATTLDCYHKPTCNQPGLLHATTLDCYLQPPWVDTRNHPGLQPATTLGCYPQPPWVATRNHPGLLPSTTMGWYLHHDRLILPI
jgi:hypothetical protein